MGVPMWRSLVACSFLIACGDENGDGTNLQLAESSSDSAIATHSIAALSINALDASLSGTQAETVQLIVSNVPSRFQPNGCVTTSINGFVVTLTFAGCTSTRGVVDVTGTFVIDVQAVNGTTINTHITATTLQIGGANVDVDATCTYIATTNHQLSLLGTFRGNGPLGHQIEHTSTFTTAWDATCATVDGQWSTTTAGMANLDIELTRCMNKCPTGLVNRERSAETLAVIYDGTTTATWSVGGRMGTFALDCVQ